MELPVVEEVAEEPLQNLEAVVAVEVGPLFQNLVEGEVVVVVVAGQFD